jgi:hypothetical protein
MRILSIGQGMPDPAMDNYNWASALSFFDFDALLIDPMLGVSKFVEDVAKGDGEYQTYDDIPVVEGFTNSDAAGLVDILRRRRDETERFLARGGLIVCFTYPDVAHNRVLGFTGFHRYHWLPAPQDTDYGPDYLKPASGRSVKVIDWEHPFAGFLDTTTAFLYRASIAEGAAGFPGAKIIARSPGGAAVAADVPVGGGRVIFIPALTLTVTGQQRTQIAASLSAAIRNTLLTEAEGSAPDWIEEISLPGIEDALTKMEDTEAKLDELESELDAARNEYRSLDRYRRILWQEGKYGFELPIRDVFTLLGGTGYSQPDEPAIFNMGGQTVMVEAESSPGEVGMDPHYRLRERIEARIAKDKRRAYGLIVVNGYSQTEPSERERQFADPLRIAAESMRYCVVTATDLFDAVRDKLGGKSDGKAFLKRLVETEGVFTPGEPEEEAEAEETPTESTTSAKGT